MPDKKGTMFNITKALARASLTVLAANGAHSPEQSAVQISVAQRQPLLDSKHTTMLEASDAVESAVAVQRAIVLTAIPVEYNAVRVHLSDLHEEIHPRGTIYERGSFSAGAHTWDVLIVEAGAGNDSAAAVAERAISYFKPDIMLFVGVAGGIKDVQLGDVVVATKVYGYEFGKSEKSFKTRPSVFNTTFRMEQRAKAEARKADWLQRIEQPLPGLTPKVIVAPIAAGNKVIASTSSTIYKLLKSHFNDTVAVEMEGHGFLSVAHTTPHIEAMVIRGISDLIDNKAQADAANFQKVAAQNASAFAFEMLTKISL